MSKEILYTTKALLGHVPRAQKHTLQSRFYQAIGVQHPFFEKLKKDGEYEHAKGEVPAHYFTEAGLKATAKFLTSSKGAKVKMREQMRKELVQAPAKTKPAPKPKKERRAPSKQSLGNSLYRICVRHDVEPVFDGVNLNVEATIAKVADSLD